MAWVRRSALDPALDLQVGRTGKHTPHTGGRTATERRCARLRINPDGCRFTVVQTTPKHAGGVAGEKCTVNGSDSLGNPLTTRYTLESLVMELEPDDASQRIEVFHLDVEQSSSLGT